MTLNDLCVRFKVIDSLNAAKMAKYSLVLTPTPCIVAGCIISVISRHKIHTCTCTLNIYLFTYLLTYLHIHNHYNSHFQLACCLVNDRSRFFLPFLVSNQHFLCTYLASADAAISTALKATNIVAVYNAHAAQLTIEARSFDSARSLGVYYF